MSTYRLLDKRTGKRVLDVDAPNKRTAAYAMRRLLARKRLPVGTRVVEVRR